MKRLIFGAVLYLMLGFLTHSYFFLFRVESWKKFNVPNTAARAFFGSVFWPVYWTSRASTKIVKELSQISVKIEKEE